MWRPDRREGECFADALRRPCDLDRLPWRGVAGLRRSWRTCSAPSRSDTQLYGGLNFVGAALACYSSYLIDFMPFVVLEGVWALVGLISIVRGVFRGPSGHDLPKTP